MPRKTKRLCRVPLCPETTRAIFCRKHGRDRARHKQQPQQQGNTTERGYGADWQKLSRRYKRQHPLCEECAKQDRVRAADDVDHIVAFDGIDDPKRLDWSNLRSLCRKHHNDKTHGIRQPPGGGSHR